MFGMLAAIAATLWLSAFGLLERPDAKMPSTDSQLDPRQATPACTEPGDQVFNAEFYRLASDLHAWDKETAGGVTVYTSRTGIPTIALKDQAGALTRIGVPDGGSLVVSSDFILVSRIATKPPKPVKKNEKEESAHQSGRLLSGTTVYNKNSWQTVQLSGCAQSFTWDGNANCWVSQCQGSGGCSATVTYTGGIGEHSGTCGDDSTMICDGALFVH